MVSGRDVKTPLKLTRTFGFDRTEDEKSQEKPEHTSTKGLFRSLHNDGTTAITIILQKNSLL